MYHFEELQSFAQDVFISLGCPPQQAQLAAEILIDADLKGIDSHGIARLKGYVRLWEKERINSAPKVTIPHQTPSTAVMDGDQGLGLVVAPQAMNLAIEKARAVGSGWVSVKNSNHYGIAGYHACLALEHDMIGISMTNASPLVAPTFSAERLLGTNPIAVAIPALEEPPFVADFATTTVANGKLEVMKRKQAPIPAGWAQDQEGNPSTSASSVEQGGALLPLGGARLTGGHKGFCLGSIVDIFSAVLSGANYGPWVPPFVSFLDPPDDPVGAGIGHFFGAMRVDAFRPATEFKTHMDQWIRRFRNSQTISGQPQVLIPGDPERTTKEERKHQGIPLLPAVVQDLQKLADDFSLEPPKAIA